MSNKLNFRLAIPGDVDVIMKFCSNSPRLSKEDSLFSDYKRLQNFLSSENSIWFVCEKDEKIGAFLSVIHEKEHKLCKIFSMRVDSSIENANDISKKILLFAIDYLGKCPASPDVLYTTTRYLTSYQQKLTMELGFKILGIFPNAPGLDDAGVNVLTAYYFNDVLVKKRYSSFSVHPLIEPIYEIARTECGLKKLPAAKIAPMNMEIKNRTPETLEAIQAPKFVLGRFEILKKRKIISIDFYPFQEPNMLITNPEQTIEIFVKAVRDTGFAAIIAERIDAQINPVTLYTEVAGILRSLNISYIEIINDAADTGTIDCILKAGYVPCAYFPCLKKHGNMRRDYVVFSKSFKKIFQDSIVAAEQSSAYAKYLEQYRRIEEKLK